MRTREAGGYEPDETEQQELFTMWHTSRTAIALPGPERQALLDKHGGERGARLAWIVDEFLKVHAGEPNVARKWIYVWCEAVLGRPIEARPYVFEERSGTVPPGVLRQAIDRVRSTQPKGNVTLMKLTDGEDE